MITVLYFQDQELVSDERFILFVMHSILKLSNMNDLAKGECDDDVG